MSTHSGTKHMNARDHGRPSLVNSLSNDTDASQFISTTDVTHSDDSSPHRHSNPAPGKHSPSRYMTSSLGGIEVEPVAHLRTVEGIAFLHQFTSHQSSEMLAHPVLVRIAIGPNLKESALLDDLLANAHGTLPEEAMQKLLSGVIGDLTGTSGFGWLNSEEPEHIAVNILIEEARAHPDVPITFVSAHGFDIAGKHYLECGPFAEDWGIAPVRVVIEEAKARDRALGHTSSTIVLLSCNKAALLHQDTTATLIYRTGVTWQDVTHTDPRKITHEERAKLGDIAISRPSVPVTLLKRRNSSPGNWRDRPSTTT